MANKMSVKLVTAETIYDKEVVAYQRELDLESEEERVINNIVEPPEQPTKR